MVDVSLTAYLPRPSVPVSETASSMSPPLVAPTIYDETFRGVRYHSPSIWAARYVLHMTGCLDEYPLSPNGSFGICVARGECVFIGKVFYTSQTKPLAVMRCSRTVLYQALLESIPEEHRPRLDKSERRPGRSAPIRYYSDDYNRQRDVTINSGKGRWNARASHSTHICCSYALDGYGHW